MSEQTFDVDLAVLTASVDVQQQVLYEVGSETTLEALRLLDANTAALTERLKALRLEICAELSAISQQQVLLRSLAVKGATEPVAVDYVG